jgi:hypothetical protein
MISIETSWLEKTVAPEYESDGIWLDVPEPTAMGPSILAVCGK